MQTVFKKKSLYVVPVIMLFTMAAFIAFVSVPNAIEIKNFKVYINDNAAYLQILFIIIVLISVLLFINMSGNEIVLQSDRMKVITRDGVSPTFIHYKNIISVNLTRSRTLAETRSRNASYYQTSCNVDIHLDNEDIIQVKDMDIDDIELFSKNLKALIDKHNNQTSL